MHSLFSCYLCVNVPKTFLKPRSCYQMSLNSFSNVLSRKVGHPYQKSTKELFKLGQTTARVVKEDVGVRFNDVAGCREAKVEIIEFVNILKNPESYKNLGVKVPKGVMLTGPPGTGKTLLAKATAGEAGVPFITVSGAKFLEMYSGVGPSRVKDMFDLARKHVPCIVFIDEIDALAKKRSADFVGSTDPENTLIQLLSEMDGFSESSNILILAATNRADVLDPSLLRPGRFDRQIYVGMPDIRDRASIFEVHLKRLKTTGLNKEELSKEMASLTPGLSGAAIASLCNEAAMIAARCGHSSVQRNHFETALDKIGTRPAVKIGHQPMEKKIDAYHEAGHVVTGWFLEHADPLIKASIIPGKNFTRYLPTERHSISSEQLFHKMCTILGGKISEEIFCNAMTLKSQDDLREVTRLAYSQVVQYGMSKKLGNVSFEEHRPGETGIGKPYSKEMSRIIDEEVNKVVRSAYHYTRNLLLQHKNSVEKVAHSLLERQQVNREDVTKLLGPRPFVEGDYSGKSLRSSQ